MISKITSGQSLPLEEILRQKSGESGKARFQQELTRAISGTSADAVSPHPTEGLQEINAASCPAGCSNLELEKKTDALLNLLDTYAQALSSPSASLKDISTVVNGMQQQAESLLNSSELAINGDEGLIDIAKQSVIAAQNEVLRFQRGDYL